MFIGHFAAGMAAKSIDKKPSLGTYFIAAQLIDLLWPFFLILGIEKVKIDPGNTAFTPLDFVHYPLTHSLFAVVIWGLLFSIIYYLIKKDLRSSIILGCLVVSHWVLDFITHRPDLLLFPSSDYFVGLGLWNSIIGTLIFESSLFLLGLYIFLKSKSFSNNSKKYGFWGLVIFLAIIYVMNIIGPPPPNAEAIGYVGLAQWLFVIIAYWVDKE